MRISPGWFAEQITVRPFEGSGPYGDVFADTFTVLANVDSSQTLVRGSDGEEITGEATFHLPPVLADGRPAEVAVPEQSEITYRGRTGVALTVKPHTVRGRVIYVSVTST